MRDVREKIRRNIVRQYNSEAKGAVRHALADYDEALFTAADAAPVADTVTRVMTIDQFLDAHQANERDLCMEEWLRLSDITPVTILAESAPDGGT